MGFPDDYRRVRQAGGTKDIVDTQTGLARQILVDTDTWNARLMDGATPGGFPFVMRHTFAVDWAAQPQGNFDSIGAPITEANPVDGSVKNWTPTTLRSIITSAFEILSAGVWIIKDSVLPARLREFMSEQNDPNLQLSTGWSMINPSFATNMPSGVPTESSIRMALHTMAQSSANVIQLLYVRDGSNRVWVRSRVNSTWEEWVLVSGVTGADLALKANKAGDTFTGRLILAATSAVRASLNMLAGTAPATPADGDIWAVGTQMFWNIGGSTRELLHSGRFASLAEAKAGSLTSKPIAPDTLAGAVPSLFAGNYQVVSRLLDTTYQNLTGKWLLIHGTPASNTLFMYYSDDGTNMIQMATATLTEPNMIMIPPGKWYRFSVSGSTTVTFRESVGAL